MRYRDPDSIVSTAWLDAHLDRPEVRVYDCTVHLRPAESGAGVPYHPESGLADYRAGHIPGAAFLDLIALSDRREGCLFMNPSSQRFVDMMSSCGVGDDLRVVLYSAGHVMWATRVWWMLRAHGFQASVLDGGLRKWTQEGREVSTAPVRYASANFVSRPRRDLFVDKTAVLAAMEAPHTLLVNALAEKYYRGRTPSRYGRPGRIPGSVNVPAANLIDPDTHEFVPPAVAAERFEQAGIADAERVVAYCGGGVSASVDLFLLHQLGYDDLALYDASMSEWARDDSLPVECD